MNKVFVGPCPVCFVNLWKNRWLPFIQKTSSGISINVKRVPYEMNEKGRHFWVLQTDGSRMMIAICKKCYSELTDETVKKVFADIIHNKLLSIYGTKNEYALFDRIRTVEVYKWAGEEKEIVEYLKGIKSGQEHSSN